MQPALAQGQISKLTHTFYTLLLKVFFIRWETPRRGTDSNPTKGGKTECFAATGFVIRLNFHGFSCRFVIRKKRRFFRRSV
jgi:hypothetical protein